MQYLYLCIICLVTAAVFIVLEKMGRFVAADIVKGVASAFFVALGLLGVPGCTDSRFALFVVIGLVLGAVADVLLNLRYVFEGEKAKLAFLAGIVVFLAGHIAYIVACLPYCDALVPCTIIGVVLTCVLLYWIFKQIEASTLFKVFGFFYLGAIVTLNCIALFVLVTAFSPHWAMFFAGTLLFLVSDIILILNNFGPKQRFWMRISNLMLYYVGQLLIALCLQLPF